MFNYFPLVFLFLVINNSFSQELTATQKIPDTAIPGGDYVVEITINKTVITGFMKFLQGVPAGCTAKEMESNGGSFSFSDGSAKIIWITPPAESQFTISYLVNIPGDAEGAKNINGKIAYLLNKERKVYDLETKTVKIGDPEEKKEPPTPAKEEEKEPPLPADTVKEEPIAAPIPVVIKKEEDKLPVARPEKNEEKKTAPVNLPASHNTPVTAIPSSAGKTFRVQIGAFSLKPVMTGVPELSIIVLENGVTKYFSGNFSTYEEAVKHKKRMIEKDFPGAFIVSFENGKIVR